MSSVIVDSVSVDSVCVGGSGGESGGHGNTRFDSAVQIYSVLMNLLWKDLYRNDFLISMFMEDFFLHFMYFKTK